MRIGLKYVTAAVTAGVTALAIAAAPAAAADPARTSARREYCRNDSASCPIHPCRALWRWLGR